MAGFVKWGSSRLMPMPGMPAFLFRQHWICAYSQKSAYNLPASKLESYGYYINIDFNQSV